MSDKMIRLARMISIIFILPICGANGAPDERYQRPTQFLKEAEALLNDLDKFQQPGKAEAALKACYEGFAVEKIVDEYKKANLKFFPTSYRDKIVDQLEDYFECQAYVRGNESACSDAGRIQLERDSLKDECILEFHASQFFKEKVTKGPNAEKVCGKILGRLQESPFNPGANDKVCSIFSNYFGKPAAACSEFAALGLLRPPVGAFLKECPRDFSFIADSDSACAALPQGRLKERCQDRQKFRKAYAGNNPNLCGRSGVCLALMGVGIASCADYTQALSDTFCGRLKDPAMLVYLARQPLADAWDALNGLQHSQSKEVTELLKRYKLLETRLSSASRRLGIKLPGKDKRR